MLVVNLVPVCSKLAVRAALRRARFHDGCPQYVDDLMGMFGACASSIPKDKKFPRTEYFIPG